MTRLKGRRARGHELVPPQIASLRPGHVDAGAPHHDRVLQAGYRRDRLVGHALHLHGLAAAEEAVGGDEERGLAVGQARGHGRRSVAGEDGDDDGAELGQRQHGRDRLGDHGQEDAHARALLDAQPLQGTCQAVGCGVQLGVGQGARRALFALPHHGSLASRGATRALIHGVVGVVIESALEPARPGHPTRQVKRGRVLLVKLQLQVAHGRVPEPRGVGRGPGQQRMVGVDAHGAHEAAQAAALHIAGGRAPDHVRRVGVQRGDRRG